MLPSYPAGIPFPEDALALSKLLPSEGPTSPLLTLPFLGTLPILMSGERGRERGSLLRGLLSVYTEAVLSKLSDHRGKARGRCTGSTGGGEAPQTLTRAGIANGLGI